MESVNNNTNTTIVSSVLSLTIQLPPSNITLLELWKSISTCMFAVTCQTTLVGLACIHGSKRVKRHFLIGLLSVWVVYTTITICDIYIFPKINDNILDTFLLCIPGAVFVGAFYKISILTTIPVLFISVCGEFPYINHIIIKAIWLATAILTANFFTSLGWILAIFGFIAGSLNIVIVPIMSQVIIIK